MKIKLTKTLKTEQKTLHILLVTGIVAFLLSILLELVVSQFMCVSLYETLHLNYLVNILLGISCSAVISFIGLIFPYLYRKNGQIDGILSELKEIYYKYLIIHKSISDIREQNDYSFEKSLYTDADELTKKIYAFIANYENSNITSEDIEVIKEVLRKNIIMNLEVVKKFCSIFILYENIVKENSLDTESNTPILKDVTAKRAQKDCYKFLLEKIESLFPLTDLEHVYNNIWNLSDLKNNTIKQFEQLAKDCDESYNLHLELAIQLEISNKIIEIKQKHYAAYINECDKIEKRLSDIIDQMEKDNINNNSFINEIYVAMRNDDLQKTEQMIKELENKIKIKE